MDITGLIVQLVSGALGGNFAGALLRKFNLGTVANSIVGILGGGIGGQLLGALGLGAGGGAADLTSILADVAAGAVGGGVLLGIVGLIRQLVGK